jgi:hypothetical protein
VILNTSFNLRGEPIVTTPANAFSTFSKSEMDSLVLGNFIVDKPAISSRPVAVKTSAMAEVTAVQS